MKSFLNGFALSTITMIRGTISPIFNALGASAILQDADRLDAPGAIGLMRTVTCGCRLGATYYDVNEPFATERALDDRRFTLDHFYVKLFKLPELMNTRTGRREADRRVKFMKNFVDELRLEMSVRSDT